MTAPPAGALEACPFCGGEPQMWGDPRQTFIRCGNDQCIVYTTMPMPYNDYGHADSAIAAWNRRTHGPALLAALRLREGCEGLVDKWSARADRIAKPYGFVTAHSLGNAQSLVSCADDLARVLEESATGDEAGSA